MNKIVIIGNGFDLAHDLKTSYKDLMNFIKEDANLESKKPGRCGNIHYDLTGDNGYIAFAKLPTIKSQYYFTTCRNHPSIYFNSLFNEFNKYEKWVDLESLYFKLLKANLSNLKNIDIINNEFNYLKNLLHDYLLNKVENNLPDYHQDFRDCYFFEPHNQNKLLGIINFNYTKKALFYHMNFLSNYHKDFYHENFSLINIHGELEKHSNPIIFGYGDDNSKEYKSIQNLENNLLLKNFKTFQYLRTSNYQRILSLLELENNIKVEVIGHSCGLSDKTLLRSIFQHNNVKKIEYRYHESQDIYFENIYNMSRIFDDNELMRKKVVSLSDTAIIDQINLQL